MLMILPDTYRVAVVHRHRMYFVQLLRALQGALLPVLLETLALWIEGAAVVAWLCFEPHTYLLATRRLTITALG